jgi:flagellum-specific peptidoglycan hydrolase FlgJ
MMTTPEQQDALVRLYEAAKLSGHVYPAAAACEGVDETRWGASGLYLNDNNVFGTKQHVHPIFGTVNLPTKEFLHHAWVVVEADFVKYPTLAAAFADRMSTLVRLQTEYPNYAAALVAKTPEAYLVNVSKTWATNPDRAIDCILILHDYLDLLTK